MRARRTASVIRYKVAPLILISAGLVFAGCGPRVRGRLYPGNEPAPAPPRACNAEVYRSIDDVPRPYKEIGEVSIGDSGFSVDCGRERVLAEVRKEVCRLSGDAALVTLWDAPDLWSSCVRIKAKIIRYDEN
jgi:hypothetical protein